MTLTINTINTRIAGVMYEGRQAIIAQLNGDEPCRIEPEPQNPYDSNALRVMVSHEGNLSHIGYVPKDVAAIIAPYLDGENLMVKIIELTGGFEMRDGDKANLGVRIRIDYQSENEE